MSSIQSRGPRLVARGNFDVLSVQSVLQALSISRQHTTVYFHGSDGATLGRVLLKSGMLLGVDIRDESVQGIPALKRLLGKPMSGYSVERVPSRPAAKPIAPLTNELLSPAIAQEPVEQATVAPSPTATQPATPAVVPEPSAPKPPVTQSAANDSTVAPAGNGNAAPARPSTAEPPAVSTGTSTATFNPPATAKTPIAPTAPPALPTEAKATPPAAKPPVAPPSKRDASAVETAPTGAVPIVAVAGPKGGSGKTTVVLNLAVSLARSGLKVVVIDLDPNGDVLSSLAAREAAPAGVYDYLAGNADASKLRLATVLPELGIIPARGTATPNLQGASAPDDGQFRDLFARASSGVDLVLVDTPAGMFGLTQAALSACTHVLGVFQAEAIAARSFPTFTEVMGSLGAGPTVAGVVVNMFSRERGSSRAALAKISSLVSPDWLLGATIPYSDALLESAERGLPVSIGKGASPALGGLFDALAGEVRERLGLTQEQHAPSSFIVT